MSEVNQMVLFGIGVIFVIVLGLLVYASKD